MPYGHFQTGNGTIQGKHLSHYTCKCTHYQVHYFNRYFIDRFSSLSNSPSQRPIQTGMQGRGDTKREAGIQQLCVLLLLVLHKTITAWSFTGKKQKGSPLATSVRCLFCEIKHLESQLGWPKPKHKGPECFSTPLVKTCLDFWLLRAAVSCQQQWPACTANIPSQLFPALQHLFRPAPAEILLMQLSS